jgi:methyl-accepting chemotaxis protein
MSEELDLRQIEVIENTFSQLADKGDKLVERFYNLLFERFPDVKPLFANVDQKEQEKKLLASLALVVNNIRKPEVLGPALEKLGKNHQGYGAVAEHYPAVAGVLLEVMNELAGELWTTEVEQAWTNALNTVAAAMLDAYDNSEVVDTIEEDGKMDNQDNGDQNLKQELDEALSKLDAISKVQAVIEFNLDGTIVTANENFLSVVGYSLEEIQGKHHRMFVESEYGNSTEYKEFWQKLNNGEFVSGQFKRINKKGEEVWINASYNPVFDQNGKLYKVVKFATDGTELRKQQQASTRLQVAVDGCQSPMIMIDRDFIITYANDATVELLTKYQDKFKEVWPSFDVKGVMGTCIDVFHKNPEHQRKLLADPGNLPYKTDIEINGLKFSLTVSAQMDPEGKYIGNTLEWQDVTELRIKENEQVRLQVAVDGCQSPMIMIDRDFIITYANEATVDLLTKYQDKFKEVWPSFDVSGVMGTCIDMFHKNPTHQRKLLDDPNNLPYQTDIEINGLKFALTVSAQRDAAGNYIGNTLEWQDVTEQRQKELEVARLQSAVDGAQANLMLCDEDLNITYANPSVVEMLRNRQTELRAIWPGLDVDNLVGQNIDQFHKRPEHQRRLLSDINSLPANAEIKVGELEFGVNATAITDSEGNYMGNMVEWRDITEEKDAERQIENLINAASDGELDTRLDANSYTGFMNRLASSINNLMDAVVEPLNESTRVIESLSDGDLTQTMDGEFQGQFLTMQSAVNSSISNLLKMVGEITESAGSINTSANEIAQGNLDLSQRTEEQASSLEETASSIEELTGTVKQNADNAQQANQLASSARSEAEKGGAVVSNAIEAMGEINQSSKKIADIIGVIDEIAFQTNLLALNAAVEAARAGEQGRGFAVVAAEVRNLAQRSAGAAKEIKTLINDSVQKVEEGSKLVDESGSTLEEIVNSVQKVSDIIAEIAAASSEQSTGIDQINKAISQMDEMTQQNASLVEEAAAASESMDEQAKGLTKLIGFFNTGQAVATSHMAERRGDERPWKEEHKAAAPSTKVDQKVASAGSDSDWEEF